MKTKNKNKVSWEIANKSREEINETENKITGKMDKIDIWNLHNMDKADET